MEIPRISVVMCTYNGERFLREQLDSIVGQTLVPWEVIVQDDGSTDGTLSILADYAAHYPFLKVFRNEGEHGVNANFFSAMRRAGGELIAISDQDDVWELDKLELQVAALGDAVLCGGRSVPFSGDGSFVYADPRRPNVTLLRMLYTAEVAGHTMLLRHSFLQQLPADCTMYHHNYYDMILSVAAAASGRVVWVDNVLVHQRRYRQASTYSSGEASLPTVGNGFNMLWWCLRHYRQIKMLSADFYRWWEDLLLQLPADTREKREALRLLRHEQQRGVVGFLRFQLFCVRHRFELFHTRGSDPVNLVRALLFPLTSCYYRRNLLTSQQQ